MRSRETGACRRSLEETSLLALAGEHSCLWLSMELASSSLCFGTCQDCAAAY